MAKTQAFSAETDAVVRCSYDGFPVHEKMIKDEVRTRSYMDAMENNRKLFEGKVALDIGCGTGILSLFAVRAGAKHVYAIDVSSMIDTAREIAKVNGMADKVTFIKGKVEETHLPKVDIIVSEWMGFCLLSEMNLDCVLHARDRCLLPGGLMMPDKTSLHIAAMEDVEMRRGKVDYWDNAYNLDFSPVKPMIFSTAYLATPNASSIFTNAPCVLNLDIQTIQVSETVFKPIPFQLVASRNGTVHAFLAWFDYDFTAGSYKSKCSTGPFSAPTHWKQTMFYIKTPLGLMKDEKIYGQISLDQHGRDLNVQLLWGLEAKAMSGSGLYKVDCME